MHNVLDKYQNKIGVLDIQGSVEEHVSALEKAVQSLHNMNMHGTYTGHSDFELEIVRVKKCADLNEVCGLIIPGGESTTLSKLLNKFGLKDTILARAKAGMPIYGTCAGAILLASEVFDVAGVKSEISSLGLIDISIERNAYGRQLDSFETKTDFVGTYVSAIFIRAPRVLKAGEDVSVLSRYKGEIVAARQGNIMISCFHPELSSDTFVHRYFLDACIGYAELNSVNSL